MKTGRQLLKVALLSLVALTVKADFFNDYFDDKVFGRDPGPCPNDDGSCRVNLETENLSPSVANIEFCLLDNFFITICDELKDWVDGGTVDIFRVVCEDVGVGDISLTPLASNSAVERNRISVQNVFQRCRGGTRLTDVVLTSGVLRVTVSLTANFQTNPNSGLDIAFDLVLAAAGGFDTNLVDSGEIENCDLNIDLGISVDNTDFDRLRIEFFDSFFGFNVNNFFLRDVLVNLLLTLIEATFGSIVCDVIEQAGTLNNGDPGAINTALNQLNQRYDELRVPTFPDIRADDEAFVANPASLGVSAQDFADSLNLKDSNSLEFISVTLNDFLGDQNVDPLPINQAINLLTDPDGSVFFDLTAEDISFFVPLDFADATARIVSVQVDDLNTIDFFQFLQNDFSEGGNGLDFTLEHQFDIDRVVLRLKIELKVERGEWVTQSSCGNINSGFNPTCTSDQEVFTFDFGVTANDVAFSAATLTAFNIDEIGDIQMGQIFDREFTDFLDTAERVLTCVAPSFYVFKFTDLVASVGLIENPFVENFSGEGLDALINNSADLVNTLLKNLLANDLPFLMRGPVREFVNVNIDGIVNPVVPGECDEYVQIPSADPFLVFNEEPFNAIFPVINDVLGNFEADSDVDFNDFLQRVFEYYSENADEFVIESTGVTGDWDTKPEAIPLGTFPKFQDETAFLRIESFSIRNLDTVNLFNLLESAQFPRGFTLDLAFAENGEVLEFLFAFDFQDSSIGLNEVFDFTIRLQQLDIDLVVEELLINLDSVNRLRLEQLEHIPCVQSTLDGFTPNTANSKLSAGDIEFQIDFFSSSSSALRGALNTLQAEFVNSESNARFTRVVNYFLDIGFESGLNGASEFNFSLTPEECDNVDSDVSTAIGFFIGLDLPDTEFFATVCLADIPELQDLAEFEQERLGFVNNVDELEGDLFKFGNNFLIEILSNTFSINTNDGDDPVILNNLLLALANATGNPVVDIFVLEEDGVTVNLEIPLNEANEVLSLVGLDPLSVANDEGFLAETQLLRVRNIDRFLQELELFKPESDFTLSFHLGFSSDEALTIEIISVLEINATIVDLAPPDAPPIREEITFKADLTGVSVDFEIFTALRTDQIKELSVAHFLTVSEEQVFSLQEFASNCFFKNFLDRGAEVRTFQISISEVSDPTFTIPGNNVISPGVEGVIEELAAILIDFYVTSLPNICENCLKQFANDELAILLELSREPDACPVVVPPVELSKENEIFRFSDSGLWKELQDFLNEFMYADEFDLWNVFIDGFTKDPFFENNPATTGLMNLFYKDVDYGALEVNFTKLEILNWNNFNDVRILEPANREDPDFDEETDPFRVTFAFGFEGETTFDTFETIVGYEFFKQAPEVRNELRLKFDLANVSFAIESFFKVNLNTFMKIQFDQVDTLEELPCLLTPVQEFDVLDFNLTIGSIVATFDCVDLCEAELLSDLTASGEFSSDNSQELVDVFDTFVFFVVDYIESSPAQRLINVALETSEDTCASIVEGLDDLFIPGEEDLDAFRYMGYVFVVAVFFAALASFYQYPRHRRRKARILKAFHKDHEKEYTIEEEVKLLDNELSSLAQSPAMPLCVKIFIPVMCLLNVAVLTWGVLTQGAMTVLLELTIAGMELNTIDLVPFTVISIINDIWASGGYVLAVVIATGSCAWPIVKSFIIIFFLYTPGTIISKNNRGRYLEIMDIMGKWSLLDVFTVIITLAALRTSVDLSQQDNLTFLDELFLSINVTLRAENGIVILGGVGMSSLLVNHVLSYYHGKTIEHYRKQFDKIAGNPKLPARALVKRGIKDYKFANRAIVPGRMKMLFGLHLIGCVLVFAGISLPFVTFELGGLAGLFIGELDEAQRSKSFSVLSLGLVANEGSKENFFEAFVLFFFQFQYYVVSTIAPIFQMIVLSILLLKKFSLNNSIIMLQVVMITSFWAALEAVIVGITFTLTEISDVSDFIIDFITDDVCTNIQGALEVFAPNGEDGTCLSVTGRYEVAIYPLLAGVAIELFVLLSSTVLAQRMIQDRYYFIYIASGLRPREPKPPKLGYARDKLLKLYTRPVRRKKEITRKGSKDESPSDIQAARALGANNPRFNRAQDEQTEAFDFGHANGNQMRRLSGETPADLNATALSPTRPMRDEDIMSTQTPTQLAPRRPDHRASAGSDIAF